MEKILKYQNLITDLLEGYARVWSDDPQIRFEVVFDVIRRHYLLLCIGWNGDDYTHHIAAHLSIQNNKIWIHKNATDQSIAEALVEQGVPKSDIVLGMQPPAYRQFTEYAAA